MNTQTSLQPIQTQLPAPTIPTPQLPQNLPIDPSNPLTWIILLTLFLTRADKTIESTTQLIQSLTDLLKALGHREKK